MTFTAFDLAYYGILIPLVLVYFATFRPYRVGGVSSFFFFRNASVVYFCAFSVLLGKLVYEGATLVSADFDFHFYQLMFYYATTLLVVASVFNLCGQRDTKLSRISLNAIPLILVLLTKAVLLLIDRTPMQELLLNGLVEAHVKQIEWHEPGAGGVVSLFYTYFSAAWCILFIVYFYRTRSIVLKLALIVLLVETSGFYLSKSGVIVPLVVLLALSGIRLSYVAFALIAGVIAVFYVRLGLADLDTEGFFEAIGERFVLETGYGNTQLDLYKSEHPPLGYESRYYLGFNTLFGLQPAVDASRQAYALETGQYGATTSGHSSVSLYAFWGPASYIVLPILLCFVFYVDKEIVRRLATDFGLAAYLFIAFKAVNYLTVDIQRLISFQTIINLTFFFSVAIVFVVGRLIKLPLFSKPISLYGPEPARYA